MKLFLSFLTNVLALLLLVVCHFFFSYALPFPLSNFNIIFTVLILFMLFSQKGSVVWMAFFTHLCIELYSVSPFGIVLFSSTLSILFMFWLSQYFFTNRSWYSSIILTFLSLTLYRIFSFFIVYSVTFFNTKVSIPWYEFFILSGWEFLFTQIGVLIGFFIIQKFQKNNGKKQFKYL